MPVAHVRLNKKHLAKLHKGKNFQLTHEQLEGHYPHGLETHDVELELSIPHYKKFVKNVQSGKGHRFDVHHIVGGSFGSFFKKVGNVAKSVAKTVAPVVVPLASTALKGLADTYAPEFAPITNSLIDAGSQQAMKASGSGLRRGSPEAKAHMARIRAMKGHKGKGFFGNLAKSAVKSLAPIAINQGSQLLKQQAGKYVPQQFQGIANSLIDAGTQQAQSKIGGSFIGYGMKHHSKHGGSFGGAIKNYSTMINEDSPVFRQRFIKPIDQS